MSEPRTNYVIESHVRQYAMACSSQHRAGKFKRVGSDFFASVEAEVDNLVRQIESKVREPLHGEPDGCESLDFITGYAMDKVRDRLEAAVRKIIRNKVQSTPSCGITL